MHRVVSSTLISWVTWTWCVLSSQRLVQCQECPRVFDDRLLVVSILTWLHKGQTVDAVTGWITCTPDTLACAFDHSPAADAWKLTLLLGWAPGAAEEACRYGSGTAVCPAYPNSAAGTCCAAAAHGGRGL